LRDGEPVYCDSCHDGNMFMLDRRDAKKLTKHMGENLVGQMARVDGRNHDCSTCHGESPDFAMLTTWKQTTAPDMVLPGGQATADANVLAPPLPLDGPRTPSDCGPKSEHCPLQQWMRGYIAVATATADTVSLARALDLVTAYSPDPTWSWAAISKAGADAARRGDLAGAKASCGKCHALYLGQWRESHRTRRAK
jgi:hypothetical protein